MPKLWDGRFSKPVDSQVNDFNSSLSFDSKMYQEDIWGSVAHTKMLGACGIIENSDAELIIKGLEEILIEIQAGTLSFDFSAEDIHSFVEAELTKRIGDAGKRLHTARSRNDQVATDLRLYLRGQGLGLISLLKQLILTLCDISLEHKSTVMSGYTHLQRAQPITFGHHLMAYSQMFVRDIGRLKDAIKRMNESPLGSGALAGTTYNIDRAMTAQFLEFDSPTSNSLDGVSDRDFCVELASAISLIMVHLSRFSEEIILWCSLEFKFIELDDAFATGSSIMPQKKNPDVAELVRGKSGRVFGSLMSLLTMLKGLPLAYNKDMQEDKEAIFDSLDTVNICLKTFIPMLKTMRVNTTNMKNAAAKGFINATDCADYLVKKGMAFRDAYKITGSLVSFCEKNNSTLESLEISQYKQFSELFEADVFEAINLENCVNKRTSYGGPSPSSVVLQIDEVKEKLND